MFMTVVLALVACTHNEAPSPFVKVVDGHFERAGKPYYYVGTNFWYGAILGSEGQGGDRQRLCQQLDVIGRDLASGSAREGATMAVDEQPPDHRPQIGAEAAFLRTVGSGAQHAHQPHDDFLHRVVGVRSGSYVLRGDNQVKNEYGVTDRQIIGRLSAFYRKGRAHDMRELPVRIYGAVWWAIFPLRWLLRTLRAPLGRLRRSWKSRRTK